MTYVCINMHAGVLTTDPANGNQSPQMIRNPDPTIFSMKKYTVAFPGYEGFEKMKECDYAKHMINETPHITSENMAIALQSFFVASKRFRLLAEKDATEYYNIHSPELSNNRGATMCDVKGWDQIEPRNGNFYYKTYVIDKEMENMHSIEVINGPFKGTNLLDYHFLKGILNSLKIIKKLITPDNLFAFKNGTQVIKK